MRLTILSRASDLARLQALSVERALKQRWPDLDIVQEHRATAGDRDQQSRLPEMTDKGAFTADLSDALRGGHADVVVHSWKDLPLEGRPGTTIAGTLERADPRDVLLVRRDVIARRPSRLAVLSSSPRRAFLLEQGLRDLLPWPVTHIEGVPVRGNIPTRLAKLAAGQGDALVVAKAALDRLLGFGPPFESVAAGIRKVLAATAWMVLPLREQPGAPAQGALAMEVAAGRDDVMEKVLGVTHAATWDAVAREREILAGYGGGCHQAVGATVLVRDYGVVTSVRGRPDGGGVEERWTLERERRVPRAAAATAVWPRVDEWQARERATRRPLTVAQPGGDSGLWVTRADALPEAWSIPADRLVWTSGSRTWRKLAARGIWVHGCADGLGDEESPALDQLAGRPVTWLRLTHGDAAPALEATTLEAATLVTYVVEDRLPDDLPARTHFFWTSGSQFLRALATWPELAGRCHASGPGRTRRVIHDAIGSNDRTSVWLDRDAWYQDVTP